VVTSAGKEYFMTLKPFQHNHQLAGLTEAAAKEAIVSAIKARSREIHEQLRR
jgi:hypothetical protein